VLVVLVVLVVLLVVVVVLVVVLVVLVVVINLRMANAMWYAAKWCDEIGGWDMANIMCDRDRSALEMRAGDGAIVWGW
jgi:hypothetical protein